MWKGKRVTWSISHVETWKDVTLDIWSRRTKKTGSTEVPSPGYQHVTLYYVVVTDQFPVSEESVCMDINFIPKRRLVDTVGLVRESMRLGRKRIDILLEDDHRRKLTS